MARGDFIHVIVAGTNVLAVDSLLDNKFLLSRRQAANLRPNGKVRDLLGQLIPNIPSICPPELPPVSPADFKIHFLVNKNDDETDDDSEDETDANEAPLQDEERCCGKNG